ncbi:MULTISPECIES: phage minor capsid protein [unclassified Staphylococcus]|uniref:phage minor capsid protein n=1 Tax=unclassified Staphylococcus TaxID=91994 RepID=UPI00122E6C98|nr:MULTISPECIES: phage minor capsid protein [unclassified Staphylococcus]KAA2278096.1 capsid protein [Staphylococcus sp. GDX7P312P]KAA2281467.1 capsid protein [Staphylococcus sp. GDX7P459A]
MALTQEQLDAIVRYATEQITQVIEETNIYDEKNTQRMYLAIQQIYDELGAVSTEQIPEMLQSAYVDGLQHAIEQLGRLGIGMLTSNETIGNIIQAPLHVEAISNIISDTLSDLKAAYRTANNYSIKHVQNAIDDVKQEIANGMIVGMTDKQIAQRVGKKFSEKGMTAFVTKDGKHLPLDFYANTVVKTKIQTATNHAHLNRYADLEVGYITVTGNVPTCHECARYRDIVFSTKPGDPDFPYINLFTTFPKHPHCRCNFKPYIKKFKSDEQLQKDKDRAKQFDPNKDPRTENEKKRYDAEQKAKQKARRKRLAFNRMQAKLGKDGPQSFNEFKNASKWQYHKWVAQMNKMYDPHQKPYVPSKKEDTNFKDNNNSNDNRVKINIDTNGDYLTVQNRYTEEIMKHMTEDEKGIINAYTSDYYYDINKYLLDKRKGIDEGWHVDVKDDAYKIDDVFNKYNVRTLKDATLYRGISDEELKYILTNFKQQDGDFIYTTETYKSTSIDESQTDFFNTINKVEYHLPKGAKAMSLVPLSNIPEEKEILLNINQTFKLVSFDKDTRRLVLEWIGDK